MSEFCKLVKMELHIFKYLRNWVMLLIPFVWVLIMMMFKSDYQWWRPFTPVGMLGVFCGLAILNYTIMILPYGALMSYPQPRSRFGLGNAFRMILPLDPREIYLGMVTAGNLVLLLVYLATMGVAMALRGAAAFDPILYPFIFYCYALSNFYVLVFMRGIPKMKPRGLGSMTLSERLWTFLVIMLGGGAIYYVAESAWSGAVLMAAGIVTYANCIRIWRYFSQQRPVPVKMVILQVIIIVLTMAAIAALNWNGHAMQSILQNAGVTR